MDRNSAFMTHNGLKVRLNLDYCIQFLKEDNIIPWFISIEAFDSLRGLLSIIGTIFILFAHYDPISAGLQIMILYLFGFFVSQSFFLMTTLNFVYGLVFMLYEKLSRFFIPYIFLVIATIITKEYWILFAYVIVRVICFILIRFINIIRGKRYFLRYGVYFGDVEITAIKLLGFYSDKKIVLAKWMEDYSMFVKVDNEMEEGS